MNAESIIFVDTDQLLREYGEATKALRAKYQLPRAGFLSELRRRLRVGAIPEEPEVVRWLELRGAVQDCGCRFPTVDLP